MQIVRTIEGNYLRATGRENIQSNGDGTVGGVVYRDTFIVQVPVDNEPDIPVRFQIELGSEEVDVIGALLPLPCDFDDYTVTVTIDVTPNA